MIIRARPIVKAPHPVASSMICCKRMRLIMTADGAAQWMIAAAVPPKRRDALSPPHKHAQWVRLAVKHRCPLTTTDLSRRPLAPNVFTLPTSLEKEEERAVGQGASGEGESRPGLKAHLCFLNSHPYRGADGHRRRHGISSYFNVPDINAGTVTEVFYILDLKCPSSIRRA